MILGNVLNIALSDTLREVILSLRLYNFHFNAQLDNILYNPETQRFQWFFENPLEIHINDLIRLTRRQFNTLVRYNILHPQDDLYLFDLLEDNLPPFNPVERISDWPINTYEIDQRGRPTNLTSQTTTGGRSYITTPSHGSIFYRPLHNNYSDNNNYNIRYKIVISIFYKYSLDTIFLYILIQKQTQCNHFYVKCKHWIPLLSYKEYREGSTRIHIKL